MKNDASWNIQIVFTCTETQDIFSNSVTKTINYDFLNTNAGQEEILSINETFYNPSNYIITANFSQQDSGEPSWASDLIINFLNTNDDSIYSCGGYDIDRGITIDSFPDTWEFNTANTYLRFNC